MINKTLIIEKTEEDELIKALCMEFINSYRPKYIFGRNIYVEQIISQINIDGFIDDYLDSNIYLNKPVFKLKDVPKDAIVLIVSSGRPFTAISRVETEGLEWIDYFSFYKYSDLYLTDILFNESFHLEFYKSKNKFEWIYELLEDTVSKEQFYKLINFKLSYDLKYLNGFIYKEDHQYFENFLEYSAEEEVFIDVGAYDGYTSQEFIKQCPQYKAIHIFEPDSVNIEVAKHRLKNFKNINFYEIGLSDEKEILMFDTSGSTSKIATYGDVVIKVDRLDNIIDENITFIKMDIEGSEQKAISGAESLIEKYHPKLAICVYHNPLDIWKIPEQILNIRKDYKIYLRHYTESIYEIVMFFIPIK